MDKNKRGIRSSHADNRGPRIGSPGAESRVSTDPQTPIFSLQHLSGEYCLSHCTKEEKAAFADTLHKLGRMTWSEIARAPRQGSGSEIIPRDSIGARTLPAEATEDVQLRAFRFYGKAPMVGYRIDRIFTVLFLDRDFTLYDHGA